MGAREHAIRLANTGTPRMDRLRAEVDKLKSLLDDPNPGLDTWLDACFGSLDAICEFRDGARTARRIVGEVYGDFRDNPEKPGAGPGGVTRLPEHKDDAEWRTDPLGKCKGCGGNPGRLIALRDGTYFCNPCWVDLGDGQTQEIAAANAYFERQRSGEAWPSA